MNTKPNVVMPNDWCVWIQDVDAHVLVVTKSYVDDDVQFAAVVTSPTGAINVGAVRRPKAGPPVTFEIPVPSGSIFTFSEAFHDLTRLAGTEAFRSIHEQYASKTKPGLTDVIPEGTA